MIATGLLVAILCAFVATKMERDQRYGNYMVGKTKAEVEQLLGKPWSDCADDRGGYWFYQRGMDPDAIFWFDGERVTRIERFK